MLNLFKEKQAAQLFQKNLENNKVDFEFLKTIQSLKKLNNNIDFQPDKSKLIREINIISHIKHDWAQYPLISLLKPAAIITSVVIMFLMGGIIYFMPSQSPASIPYTQKNTISNEVASISLDNYIAAQKSNDVLASEIDNTFNNIPKIPQNNKPFIYW